MADGVVEDLIIELRAGTVGVIIGCPLAADTDADSSLDRVDVGAEKEKFPAVFFLLPFDHLLDLRAAVAVAGVFHPVGGDDEERMSRYVLRARIFMNVADVTDRAADSVYQGRTAASRVIRSGQGLHVRDCPAVVDERAFV